MKKLISLLLAILLLAGACFALISCKNEEKPTTAGEQTAASQPDTTPDATPDPTPDATPDPTPDVTPDVTPDPTPDPTPEPTKTNPVIPGDAFEMMKAAAEKTASLTSCEYTQSNTNNTVMTMMGQTSESPSVSVSSVKIANLGTDAVVSETKTTDTSMGMTTETTVYTDKNFAYVDSGDFKVKYAADSEEGAAYMPSVGGDVSENLPDKEAFSSAEITKNADGSTTVTIQMTEEQFKKAFSKYLDGLGDSLSESGITDASVTYKDIVFKFTVLSSGYLGSFTMSFKMDMSMNIGIPVQATSEVISDTTFVDPGKTVTVTLPDLSAFVDADTVNYFDD